MFLLLLLIVSPILISRSLCADASQYDSEEETVVIIDNNGQSHDYSTFKNRLELNFLPATSCQPELYRKCLKILSLAQDADQVIAQMGAVNGMLIDKYFPTFHGSTFAGYLCLRGLMKGRCIPEGDGCIVQVARVMPRLDDDFRKDKGNPASANAPVLKPLKNILRAYRKKLLSDASLKLRSGPSVPSLVLSADLLEKILCDYCPRELLLLDRLVSRQFKASVDCIIRGMIARKEFLSLHDIFNVYLFPGSINTLYGSLSRGTLWCAATHENAPDDPFFTPEDRVKIQSQLFNHLKEKKVNLKCLVFDHPNDPILFEQNPEIGNLVQKQRRATAVTAMALAISCIAFTSGLALTAISFAGMSFHNIDVALVCVGILIGLLLMSLGVNIPIYKRENAIRLIQRVYHGFCNRESYLLID